MSDIKSPPPGMVAEAVATYGRATPVYGTPSTIKPYKIAGIEAPDAVWEFARKHDLVPYIELVVQWVRELFPTVCNFALEYVIDPEVEGYSWVEVQFYVSGTVEEIFEQYQRLNQERARHIPSDKSELIGVSIGWV